MNLRTKTPGNNMVITEGYSPSAVQASSHRAAFFYCSLLSITTECFPVKSIIYLFIGYAEIDAI